MEFYNCGRYMYENGVETIAAIQAILYIAMTVLFIAWQDETILLWVILGGLLVTAGLLAIIKSPVARIKIGEKTGNIYFQYAKDKKNEKTLTFSNYPVFKIKISLPLYHRLQLSSLDDKKKALLPVFFNKEKFEKLVEIIRNDRNNGPQNRGNSSENHSNFTIQSSSPTF